MFELMMMGVGLGLQFTSLEAWIKMDYGSHLRRYERKGTQYDETHQGKTFTSSSHK